MKYTIAVLLLAMAVVTVAQTQKVGPVVVDGTNPDARAVAALDAKLRKGLISGDTASVDSLIADTWSDTDEHGHHNDKQGLFSAIKAGDVKVESIKVVEVHYNTYGDVLVMWGTAEQKGNFKGQPFTPAVSFTDTFLKRNGAWKVIASHRSPK
jgi:hypothetical protein